MTVVHLSDGNISVWQLAGNAEFAVPGYKQKFTVQHSRQMEWKQSVCKGGAADDDGAAL